MKLRVFTCKDFEGHWPVGQSAVVVARDERQAAIVLAEELAKHGLKFRRTDGDAPTLVELDLGVAAAYVLQTGEY